MTYTAEKKKEVTIAHCYLLENCDKLICDDFQIEKTISKGGKRLCPQVVIKSAVACAKIPF